ncbi:hypothetical protein G6011_01408 [Alternaria panax]|uniref:Uncharacterized protein n=1 Tax=Alternaria panax TaxID=48097 RepID=A0AAD4IJX8_9PLEO|nr:hypothetical protein G6011_01408 [Alternaria panax]
MSQENAISTRFLIAAVHGGTRAMQHEFHQMLSVAQSRDQDCLSLKQQQKQEVEANHSEMDWMRKRIQNLEAEIEYRLKRV